MTDIETIRRALDALASSDTGDPRDPTHSVVVLAREALDRLVANTLDLSGVPDTHEFSGLATIFPNTHDVRYRVVLVPIKRDDGYAVGHGPTPAAALAAAIKRAKEASGG